VDGCGRCRDDGRLPSIFSARYVRSHAVLLGDAEHTSHDLQRGIEIARERLGPNLGPLLLGAFSAGGRLALEVAFRSEAGAHAVISIGAALPPDLRDFPVAEGLRAMFAHGSWSAKTTPSARRMRLSMPCFKGNWVPVP
jgi:predicted esterase